MRKICLIVGLPKPAETGTQCVNHCLLPQNLRYWLIV
jgi:hypothetical protein